MNIVYLLISFFSSIIGSISGIGGGIIIKPIMDFTGLLGVNTINFLSGSTVLAMASTALFHSRKSDVKLYKKRVILLSLGAIIGGITGKELLSKIYLRFNNYQLIEITQSVILLFLTITVLIFNLKRRKIKHYDFKKPPIIIYIGAILGLIASFLGIGGGPINIAVLYIMFGMDSKTAALNSLFIIFFSQISNLSLTIYSNAIPDFNFLILVLMVCGGISGGLVGSKISLKMGSNQVEKLFNFVLTGIAVICLFNILR